MQWAFAALCIYGVGVTLWGRRSMLGNWPMFTSDCSIAVDLTDANGSPVNAYSYLPSHAPSMTPREFGSLLAYLASRGLEVRGSGWFFGNQEEFPISIDGERVVG